MKTTLLGSCAGLLCLALSTACGSSGVNSGVAKDKEGSALTTEETRDVCQAIVDYRQSKLGGTVTCNLQGQLAAAVQYALDGSDATIQSSCNDAVNRCKDAAAENGAAPDTGTCASLETQDACTASVGDIETCSTETLDGYADALAAPSCGTFTRAYFDERGDQPAPAPAAESEACKTVKAECPVVLVLIGNGVDGG